MVAYRTGAAQVKISAICVLHVTTKTELKKEERLNCEDSRRF